MEAYKISAKINANATYKDKVRFMTLGEIKELHRQNGLSDDLKLNNDCMVSTLKILGCWD